MKKVEATVSPNSLNSVLNALTKAGFSNLTYFEGKGRSHQKGEKVLITHQELWLIICVNKASKIT